jgi:hypothetical protein
MPKGDTLVLTVDSYDQIGPDDDPRGGVRDLTTYSRGDSFKAASAQEYDRLIEIGAAVDPAKENERQREEAEQRIAALEAERARIEADLEAANAEADPSSLTKPELVNRLEAEGLDTDGNKAELVARYQAHLDAQT